MNRREFLVAGGAAVLAAGCCSKNASKAEDAENSAKMLFGACRGPKDVKLMKSIGYDFWEWGAGNAFIPEKSDEEWKRQRDFILAQPLPLRSCNGFLPGKFRLTGPEAEHVPAMVYAERVLRRAEEVGVKTIVFGSGGARNVPGDMLAKKEKDRPNIEKATVQFADFCRNLTHQVDDLKNVQIVIEPLRPNESNLINYVWQSVQLVKEIDSPRLMQLADIYHMMAGGESAQSIVDAGELIRHCHIAEFGSRQFPGFNSDLNGRFEPYFEALRKIGYRGGISCECAWGKDGWNGGSDFAKNLEKALETMKDLAEG